MWMIKSSTWNHSFVFVGKSYSAVSETQRDRPLETEIVVECRRFGYPRGRFTFDTERRTLISWSSILKSRLLCVKEEDFSPKSSGSNDSWHWLGRSPAESVNTREDWRSLQQQSFSFCNIHENGNMLIDQGNGHTRNWCFQKLRLRILTCIWCRQNDQPDMCAFAISLAEVSAVLLGSKKFSIMKKMHATKILARYYYQADLHDKKMTLRNKFESKCKELH